mmetsp:Transcript_12220/g.26305  ORF Transcript_12220/g.26305 Transcript_12220/m.26305 type:complete len:162 (+) Transcript_12220:105-590(+)|eukprot:CAMPEP_0202900178 /NCGR_PEP_ID=MMETSP1392-20130828/10279_1 /ASSEMBLY_ACC=CAM_ASM_000868 /TAXON_ID=225041 /ORGANISM="Chlamydomonas chlamydogama, Strain SAG 11-48b" /LENGTH=161 /DNA_ID=CAMNT_0049586517 /DNA_START=89 /DNA_END=574 /DNA_ORIENTATION=+
MLSTVMKGTKVSLASKSVQPRSRGSAIQVATRPGRLAADSSGPHISVHGRHVTVTPHIHSSVENRLRPLMRKLASAEFLESEGGLHDVDVRLMNSQAEITLHPRALNKHVHDTFLQRGHLKAHASGGSDALQNFELACEQLEKKLHKWRSEKTVKKDMRSL